MKGLKSDEDSEKTHLCTEELTISGQNDHYWTNLWRDQIGAEGVTLSGKRTEASIFHSSSI